MTGQVARAQALPIDDGDGNDTGDIGGEIDEANDPMMTTWATRSSPLMPSRWTPT